MSVFYPEGTPIDLSVVSEAYFGRTPGVNQIIEQIGIIRRKAGVEVGGSKKSVKYNITANTWPETIELNHMLEKEFGFKVCSVSIIQEAKLNAFTIPISTAWDISKQHAPDKMIMSTKTGFKYKPECGYSVMLNITSGLLFDNNFTDAEVTAVIFHEIGHNFSTAFSNELGGLLKAKYLITLAESILAGIRLALKTHNTNPINVMAPAATQMVITSNEVKKVVATINNFLDKNGILQFCSNVKDFMCTVSNAIKTAGENILDWLISLNPVATLIGALGNIAGWSQQLIKSLLGGYKDEQFADAFPGMYGLGSELTSALTKMMKGSQGFALYDVLHKTPVIGRIANTIQFPMYFTQTLFDEHPQLAARFKTELDLLENELKKENLDPRIKKEIKSQIDTINKDFNTLIRVTDENKGKEDPYVCQRIYQAWLFDNYEGDLKANNRNFSYKNKDIADQIDTVYSKTLNKVKFD